MPCRQQILVFWLESPDLEAKVCAWSAFDDSNHIAGEEAVPPYPTAGSAFRDGWRVVSLPEPYTPIPGHEYRCGHMRHRVVLEKMKEVIHA